MESEFFNLVMNNGIAVVVLAWFMFRMEKTINNNTKALTDVRVAIGKCPGVVNGEN